MSSGGAHSGGSAGSKGGSGARGVLGGTGGIVGSGGSRASGGMAGAPTGGSSGSGGVVGALPECPGATPVPPNVQRCRTSTDCTGFGFCTHDYVSGGCGACFPAPHDCTTDADCGSGNVCMPSIDGPCTCGGPGTLCAGACTTTPCAADETCNVTTGHCGPTPCGSGYTCATGTVCMRDRPDADVHGCAPATCTTDGYACPAGFACVPGSNVDIHGCAPVDCVGGAFKCPTNTDCDPSSTEPHHCATRSCSNDSSCDCGACVQGTCQDRLFVCSPPPPP